MQWQNILPFKNSVENYINKTNYEYFKNLKLKKNWEILAT